MAFREFSSERQLVNMSIEDLMPLIENAQIMREKDRKRLSRAIRKKPIDTILPIFQEIEPSMFVKELLIKLGVTISDKLFPKFFDLSMEKIKNPLYPIEDIVNILINRELTEEQNTMLMKMAGYIPHTTIQNCILTICYRQSTHENIQKYMNMIMSQIIFPFDVLPPFKDAHSFTGANDTNSSSYINSILVQLAYDSSFIRELLETSSEDFCAKLQDLLLRMHYSAEESVDSSKFIAEWNIASNSNDKEQKQTSAHEFYIELFHKINNKKISKLYQSKILKTFEKEDGTIKTEEEKCYSIPLLVDGFSSLEESLNNYLNDEKIEKDIKQKNITFISLPNTLVFNLQRFRSNGEKIKNVFSYPEQLILDGVDYRFRGSVVHGGTFEDGNYSSIIYNEGSWLNYDGQVSEISEIEYRASFGLGGRAPVAVMLFYERAESTLGSHELKHEKAVRIFRREQNNNFIMARQSLLQCRVLTQIAVKDLDNNKFIEFYIKIYMRAQIREPEVIQLASDRMKEAYDPKIIISFAKEIAKNIKYANDDILEPLRLYDLASTQDALPLIIALSDSIKGQIDKPYSISAAKIIASYCLVVGNCRERIFRPILDSVSNLYRLKRELDYFKTINVTPLLETISYLMISEDLNKVKAIIDQKPKLLVNPENQKGFEKLSFKIDVLEGKVATPRPLHERLLEMDDPVEISLAMQEVQSIEKLLQTLLNLDENSKRKIVRIARYVIVPSLLSEKQSEKNLASKICVSLLPNIDLCKELLKEVSLEMIEKKNPVTFFAILYRCLKDSQYPKKFGPVGAFESFLKKEWEGWSGPFAEVVRLGFYFDDCAEIARNIWRKSIDMDIIMPREVESFLNFIKRYDDVLFMELLLPPINKENMAYFKIRKKFFKNLEQTEPICRKALDWFAKQLEEAKKTGSIEEYILGTYYIAPKIETVYPTAVDPEMCAEFLEGITMPKMVDAFSNLFVRIDKANENQNISNAIKKKAMSHKVVAFLAVEEVLKEVPSAERLVELSNIQCPPGIIGDMFFTVLLDNYHPCDAIAEFTKRTIMDTYYNRENAADFYSNAMQKMEDADVDEILEIFYENPVKEDDPKLIPFLEFTVYIYRGIPRVRDKVMRKIPYTIDKIVELMRKYVNEEDENDN